MSGVALVYTLCGSEEGARRIARTLVEERLAACANRLAPILSCFEWEGKIGEEKEYPVLFKTHADRAGAAMARIAALHSYDVPAILSWDCAGAHPPFAEWIAAQTADAA